MPSTARAFLASLDRSAELLGSRAAISRRCETRGWLLAFGRTLYPGEQQNRWYRGVHPNGGIGYDPWPIMLFLSFFERGPGVGLIWSKMVEGRHLSGKLSHELSDAGAK